MVGVGREKVGYLQGTAQVYFLTGRWGGGGEIPKTTPKHITKRCHEVGFHALASYPRKIEPFKRTKRERNEKLLWGSKKKGGKLLLPEGHTEKRKGKDQSKTEISPTLS